MGIFSYIQYARKEKKALKHPTILPRVNFGRQLLEWVAVMWTQFFPRTSCSRNSSISKFEISAEKFPQWVSYPPTPHPFPQKRQEMKSNKMQGDGTPRLTLGTHLSLKGMERRVHWRASGTERKAVSNVLR